MKSKKLLWIGILIGFLFAMLLFGVVFAVQKLIAHKEVSPDNSFPVITQEGDLTPGPAPEKEEFRWEGSWERTGDTKFEGSIMVLKKLENGALWFKISAHNGGNSSEVSGEAGVDENIASYEDQDGSFGLSFTIAANTITVVMSGEMAGMPENAVTFEGIYRPGKQEKLEYTLTELGVFESEEQEAIFKEHTKEGYRLFMDTFQLTYKTEDLDGFPAAVTTGGIRGLFTVNEGIIMAGPDNTFWAAVIDGTVIKYYTNTEDTKILPVTIDRWRTGFDDRKVIHGILGSEMRVLTRNDLTDTGFEPMKDHSFQLEIKDFGPAEFLGGTVRKKGVNASVYYLFNGQGEVIYKIPPMEAGIFHKTRAISFQTISSGEIRYGARTDIEDIIIMEEYTDPDQEYGDIPFVCVRIYSWDGTGFTDNKNFYEELNRTKQNDNILVIMENIFDMISRGKEPATEGIEIYRDFSQKVALEEWGELNLVPAGLMEQGKKQLKLYLTDKENKIIYRYPAARQDSLHSLREAAFLDADGNSSLDLVVLADYEDGTGKLYSACDIYLRSGMEFIPAVSFAEGINAAGNHGSIAAVLSYLEGRKVGLNINDLAAYGVTFFPDRSFTLDLEDLGKMNVAAGTRKGLGIYELILFLTDNAGNILYRLPGLRQRDCHSISEMDFRDINQDGRKDLLLIINYTTGLGTDGVTPAPFCSIFLQQEDHSFINVPDLDDWINYKEKGKTIKDIIRIVKELEIE